MAANGITSIVSEPIFYGPVAPSSLDAKSSDCAVPAEEFLQLMSAARDRFHVGDDTAAISRAVGNLRGVAASWYRSRTKCPPAGTDPTALRTDWDVFVATFRAKWFRQRTRWDTSTSYLEIRQKPNEPTWVLLERIIDEYLADQELVRDATNLRLATQDPRGTPADIGRLEALPQADQDAIGRIMSNARKDSVALCLETMRDADIARAFVLACADDRLRKAVRRKAATGLDYGQLEAFIRTEDDTLKASKPGQPSSSSNHKRSQKPASASSARARGAVAAAAEAASASQDDDASDADEPTSNDLNDDQVEALIEAVRSRFPSNRRRPRRGFRPRHRSPAPQQSPQQPRDSSGRFASSYASAANSAKPMTSASSIAGCTFCSSDDHTNASCPTFYSTVDAVAAARHAHSDAAAAPSDLVPTHSSLSMSGNEW
jgi:hypothetical protein